MVVAADVDRARGYGSGFGLDALLVQVHMHVVLQARWLLVIITASGECDQGCQCEQYEAFADHLAPPAAVGGCLNIDASV